LPLGTRSASVSLVPSSLGRRGVTSRGAS
jgi:hypothetical protein